MTLLYGMFFLAKCDMSLESHCCLTVHSSTKRFSDVKCTQNLPSDVMVFEGIQILNQTKNFPVVPPLLNFQNFGAAFLGSRSAQGAETLHADSKGQGY